MFEGAISHGAFIPIAQERGSSWAAGGPCNGLAQTQSDKGTKHAQDIAGPPEEKSGQLHIVFSRAAQLTKGTSQQFPDTRDQVNVDHRENKVGVAGMRMVDNGV